MIKSTEEILLKLTPEQFKQMEDFQKQFDASRLRLLTIQNEVVIQGQNLSAIKNDASRITREKDYQSDLLSITNTKLKETQNKIDELNDVLNKAQSELSKVNQDVAEKSEKITAKYMEMKDREDSLDKREEEVKKFEDKVNFSSTKHEEEKESFKGKLIKLKEVISIF